MLFLLCSRDWICFEKLHHMLCRPCTRFRAHPVPSYTSWVFFLVTTGLVLLLLVETVVGCFFLEALCRSPLCRWWLLPPLLLPLMLSLSLPLLLPLLLPLPLLCRLDFFLYFVIIAFAISCWSHSTWSNNKLTSAWQQIWQLILSGPCCMQECSDHGS